MKRICLFVLGFVFCLSLALFGGCNKGSGLYLKLDSQTETISGGSFELTYPVLMDEAGNAVLSYEVSVISIVDEAGNNISANDGLVDFSKQGDYRVTYGVKDMPKVKTVEKVFKVVDSTPPEIRAFDYPEAVTAGRKYAFPELKLYDAAGVNEQKTKIEVIDKYNNTVQSDSKGFTVPKAGDYRFRIKTEDVNGVSKTYYYSFKAYKVENPAENKIAYLDEDFGQVQLATGREKGKNDERYTLSYTTERAYGSEKGSTVVTINENPTNVYLRLIAPHIKNVKEYSKLTFRVYVELPFEENKDVLGGAHANYVSIGVNRWVELNISTAALNENGSVLNGLTGERVVAEDITNLTVWFFRWSNPAFGGVEDKEGFPAGTKIYLSSIVAKEKDPSVIYEFTPDVGDHGAKAVNKKTGIPVNSYGGNSEHGSFVGLGKDGNSVRFYLQNADQSEDEYIISLPVIDFKKYGTVTVTFTSNNCKRMGISAEESINTSVPQSITVRFVYDEAEDCLNVTFTSGNNSKTVKIVDQDVISGYSQFEIYAVGAAYTEIYLEPIRIA